MKNIDMLDELFVNSLCPSSPHEGYRRGEEQGLREEIEACKDPSMKIGKVQELVQIYETRGDFDTAAGLLWEYMQDPLLSARIPGLLFRLGQMSEKRKDFDSALDCYGKCLYIWEKHPSVKGYFIFNNTAFCLLVKQEFVEAEELCRRAIAENPRQYNAWKNLGAALEHQDRSSEAGRAYMQAIKLSAGEVRSTRHLVRLLKRHPELKGEEEFLDFALGFDQPE